MKCVALNIASVFTLLVSNVIALERERGPYPPTLPSSPPASSRIATSQEQLSMPIEAFGEGDLLGLVHYLNKISYCSYAKDLDPSCENSNRWPIDTPASISYYQQFGNGYRVLKNRDDLREFLKRYDLEDLEKFQRLKQLQQFKSERQLSDDEQKSLEKLEILELPSQIAEICTFLKDDAGRLPEHEQQARTLLYMLQNVWRRQWYVMVAESIQAELNLNREAIVSAQATEKKRMEQHSTSLQKVRHCRIL